MESTAAWAGPYELQLTKNWTAEVAPADDAQEVWAPAVDYTALEYSSIIDIFGSSCSLQPYAVPERTSSSSTGGPQLPVEYNCYNYYAAAPQHHGPTGKGTTTTTHEDLSSFEKQMESYMNNPKKLFQEIKKEFEDGYDTQLIKRVIHRYPPSIRALDDDGLYTIPRVVAIGPYHHYGGGHLKKVEQMKHVAASHCIMKSDCSVEEVYGAVISAVNDSNARGLYHMEVMADLSDDCFLPMMFFDACFLVMYILKKSNAEITSQLYDFFESNDDDISHDIMLLENQIPLQVVNTVMNMCTADEPWEIMKIFIAMWWRDGFLQDRAVRELPRVDWDQDYYNEAPHLLGLVRSYALGKRGRSKEPKVPRSDLEKMESISVSAGAVELAKMGIFLKANKTAELPDMALAKKWIIFTELSMVPLSLNDSRACLLINMAALELCTTPDFLDDNAEFEDSGVCSYLFLLCMLMHREEDVHELRANGILQGGAGLTNKKTLDFFTSLQSLRPGPGYGNVMVEISNYKSKRRHTIAVWVLFVYNKWKYFVGVGSAIAGIITIISTLKGLEGN